MVALTSLHIANNSFMICLAISCDHLYYTLCYKVTSLGKNAINFNAQKASYSSAAVVFARRSFADFIIC